jgi:dTDP-4-amino-4,6-dideoxygalactose transaminase
MKMTRDITPWPVYSEEEIEAVTNVLKSGKVNYWTGDIGKQFEKAYAESIGMPYGIAVANGTVALELALYALGIGQGDEVITTSRTYIASASCVVARGGIPVPVDIDRDSQNIAPDSIIKHITPKTKAIIVVHLAGWPCEMDEILAIAKKYDLFVIEDCAQANGAKYKNLPVGSFGDASAFSFCQDKIISTGGEGGMLVIRNETAWKKAWAYKDIGRSYDAVYNRKHPPGFRWLTESFGTNWRMTEMQAAIGMIQLKNLEENINKRNKNALILIENLKAISTLRIPVPTSDILHAYYKFYTFIEPKRLKSDWSRDRIVHELNELGLPTFTGSCSEIYMEKAFDNLYSKPATSFPTAKELGETSLMFLIHPSLSYDYFIESTKTIAYVFNKAMS